MTLTMLYDGERSRVKRRNFMPQVKLNKLPKRNVEKIKEKPTADRTDGHLPWV